MNPTPVLELDEAGIFAYGREIVHDFTLSLSPGELVAVVGHNGAGKTTMLKGVAGLLPISGPATYKGASLNSLSTIQRAKEGIVLLPDGGSGVFPTLTVAENLRISAQGKPLNYRAPATAVDEMVVRIAPFFADRQSQLASTLSGGQRQILALSCALRMRPNLLLLDEPSIGLAPRVVEDFLAGVKEAVETLGLAALLVEQQLGAVLEIADRVLILKEGSLVASFEAPNFPAVEDLWEHF